MKTQFSKKQTIAACLILIAFPFIALAAEVTNLNIFTSSTPAKAADVNANFEKLKDAANSHEARIGAMETNSYTDSKALSAVINSPSFKTEVQKLIDTSLDNFAQNVFGELHYPHILTSDGRISIARDTGIISYQGGDTVIFRGKRITLPSFNFPTIANKTYHLRFDTLWRLIDVTDSTYNPTGLPETDEAFDSRTDSILAARVVSNGSNVLTVDKLMNKERLQFAVNGHVGCGEPLPPADGLTYPRGSSLPYYGNGNDNGIVYSSGAIESVRNLAFNGTVLTSSDTVRLNWARRPKDVNANHSVGSFSNTNINRQQSNKIGPVDRYHVDVYATYWLDTPRNCMHISVVVSGSN